MYVLLLLGLCVVALKLVSVTRLCRKDTVKAELFHYGSGYQTRRSFPILPVSQSIA